MIEFLSTIIIAAYLSQRHNLWVKKHRQVMYIAFAILQFSPVLYLRDPNTLDIPVIGQILRSVMMGTMSAGLFYVVMMTGALDPKAEYTKKLKRLRAEFSIMASIAVLFHGIYYLLYFNRISLPILLTGLGALIIMFPLLVTSFNKVKRMIGGKKFLKIQKWAYAFYALVFFHMIFAALANRHINVDKVTIYIVAFSIYTVLRLRRAYLKCSTS